MKSITVVPLGNADGALVGELAAALAETFRVPAEVRNCDVDLVRFYDETRGQYNSTRILQFLKEACPEERTILGVVPDDLFIPILTFVFGEAELNGSAAIVSYHRLESARYGLPHDAPLLAARLRKEAFHELGHVLGLLHCPDQRCVMRSSTNVEEIDLKGEEFCPECRCEMGAEKR